MGYRNQLLNKINERLRGYDLMVIETGGWYDGKDVIDDCLSFASEYLRKNGNKDNLLRFINLSSVNTKKWINGNIVIKRYKYSILLKTF